MQNKEIIEKLLEKLRKDPIYKKVKMELSLKNTVRIKPSGRLFSELLTVSLQKDHYSPIIIITDNEDDMFYIKEELKSIFHKTTSIFFPFNEESPINIEETEERLFTLKTIISKTIEFIITNIDGLFSSVPILKRLKNNILQFKKDAIYNYNTLAEKLIDMGFTKTQTVNEIGQFSVRGGIVDIYGYQMELPKRIEFFGDKIISIRSFDLFTQKTIKKEKHFTLLPMREKPGDKIFLDYLPDTTIFVYPEYLINLRPVNNSSEEEEKLSNNFFPSLLEGKKQLIFSNDGFSFEVKQPPQFLGNLKLFKEYLKKLGNKRVLIACESQEERKRVEDLFQDDFPHLLFHTLNIEEGIESEKWNIYLLTDKEIFGKGFHPRILKKKEVIFSTKSISEFKAGDYVVHNDYGIGIFEKIDKLEHKGQLTECLVLRYANNDILYVPINNMSKVSKYVGLTNRSPELSNLSTLKWARKKRAAVKAIEDMTKELLELYARRTLVKGYKFSQDTIWQKELEASFPYEETKDQLTVIKEVKKDMESQKPADRLICGEVGYGKTEVAVRVAFKAVMDNKQVILLAPTTILCEQHFNTFKERLKNFPVRIEMLSRFVKKNKERKIIADIRSGKVDIIIGTHKLLSKDIEFYDPGLLIIDEEHRFGVSQKEKLKLKRNQMDVISMSATPIPRTLQFSLLNIRDFSTIQTPPKGRLSVVTRIIRWDSELLRKIILHEIERNGQVFFVHNRIQTINRIDKKLKELVPEAKSIVTHGRMKPIEIEERMLDFLKQKYNLLVTTSIIESGIDIPTANTIIINRADTYGLAQIHQLRGRVGRGNKRAYCYLIIPQKITNDAREKLSTIYTHSHLGSGMALALRDLEIRGAGNLLGKKQHGHITKIGYQLYMNLLKETVKKIKGIETNKKPAPDIISNLDAFLPDYYCADEISRIDIYRRLSSIESLKSIEEIEDELIDRFGQLPQEAKNLLLLARLRILSSGSNIEKVTVHKNYLELSFAENRYPKKRSIEKLFEEYDRRLRVNYSDGNLQLGIKTNTKKITSDLKKVLQFLN